MKKRICVLISMMWIFICTANPLITQPSILSRNGNLRILMLEGTPYQRGLEHGRALKNDILKLLQLWKNDIERTYKTAADDFIKKFLSQTNFKKAINRWTPELWEEVKGLSDGAGIEFDTMFAFQLVDEIWVLGQNIQTEKCTSFGATKTGNHPALVAQNLDIPRFYHGFQTLIHLKETKRNLETYLFTFPGFIAANGINNHSVAVVVNAVQQLDTSKDGLPVAFVIRGILQHKSYNEAVEFLHEVRFGAPQNYLIGGSQNVASFECADNTVSQFIPFENAEFTYHTNHPLRNMNYNSSFKHFLEAKGLSPESYEHPCLRFRSLQNMFEDNSVEVSVEVLKNIFSQRDTQINNGGTFGCTIMLLGDDPALHISPGRPDEEPFQVFTFDKK